MNEAYKMHEELLHALLPIIPRTAYQDLRRLNTLVWAMVGLCLTHTVRSRCLGRSDPGPRPVRERAAYAASPVGCIILELFPQIGIGL